MEKRKEIILGALLVTLAVVLWRTLGGDGAAPGGAVPGGRPTGVDISSLRIYRVNWGALEAARPAYDPAGRNIFQFGAVPKPTPPPLTEEELAAIRKAREEAERVRKAQEEQRRRQAERLAAQRGARQATPSDLPPPPPKPRPPRITYKFIGYIGPPEDKIAVLNQGGDLLFARVGDEVGEKFRILEIGYESIKFGFTDENFTDETRTLPMSTSN
ncbi:MAG: hypothetical protein ACE5JH_02445 [Acidobacteriota bacterium]